MSDAQAPAGVQTEGDDRRLARLTMAIAAVVIVLAVGGPLVGRGTFVAVDLIRRYAPWNASTPTDFEYTHGPANDTIDVFFPARDAIYDGLSDLRVPLWDPYPNGGTPLGSQPITGLFAPINWPQVVLGPELGAAWSALLRFGVAAAGAYFLLRRLRLSAFAAACGALLYSINGFVILWNNFPQADMAAMLPLLFLAADVVLERRRARDVALLALVMAAMVLEGYPPLLVAMMYALGAFLVVRWFDSTRDPEETVADWARRLLEHLKRAVRPAALVAGGVLLGIAVGGFQMLPFLERLGVYDIGYRSMLDRTGADAFALLAMAVPTAIGRAAVVGNVPTGTLALSQGMRGFFVGAVAVVFALWAALRGRPRRVTATVYWYFVAGAFVLLLGLVRLDGESVLHVNRAVTKVLYVLPGMSQVPVTRLVAILLFFVIVVAAFGIDIVVTRDRAESTAVRVILVVGFVAVGAVSALRSEDRRIDFFGGWSWVLHHSVWPAVVAVGAVVVIVVASRTGGLVRRVALGVLPVLIAVELLMATTPMLPRAPRADYYPQAPALRYLARHLGAERFAAAGDLLFQSTNGEYGLRSVSGHSFVPPDWRKLILATSPDAYDYPTQTVLDPGIATATSPVLDQLSAKYFIAAAGAQPFGALEPEIRSTRSVPLRSGEPLVGTVPGGPLRGVGVAVAPFTLRGTLVSLEVKVRDAGGRVVARGERRLASASIEPELFVAIAGEQLAPGAPLTVELRLRSNGADRIEVAVDDRGSPALRAVRPDHDGLELTFADAGATIYRRERALPRVRWASRTEVVPSPARRVAELTQGIGADTVLLDAPAPRATGAPARVRVREDSADRTVVAVDAAGAGYLVVADGKQDDWTATVDGHAADLVDANHALVAVRVPAGTHTVTLRATPRGWHLGIVVSIVASLGVVALLLVGVRRRRRAARTQA
jgi:hypothetical protein